MTLTSQFPKNEPAVRKVPRWVPPSTTRRDESRNSNQQDIVFRRVRGILNKLTPEKFDKLCLELLNVGIDSKVILKGIILLVFEKALEEPKYSSMYAQLCKRLDEDAPDFESSDSNVKTFRRLLISKCQDEFENRSKAFAAFNTQNGTLTPEEEDQRGLAKLKMLGNIQFVGELGKLGMLHESILHRCIKQLLEKKSGEHLGEKAEDLECLCKIITTVGGRLDHDKAKQWMDQYFVRMARFSESTDLPSRIRFMLQDCLDLRENNWIPRQHQTRHGPRTIRQLHAEDIKNDPQHHSNLTHLTQPDFFGINGDRGFGGSGPWPARGGMGDLFLQDTMSGRVGAGPGVISDELSPPPVFESNYSPRTQHRQMGQQQQQQGQYQQHRGSSNRSDSGDRRDRQNQGRQQQGGYQSQAPRFQQNRNQENNQQQQPQQRMGGRDDDRDRDRDGRGSNSDRRGGMQQQQQQQQREPYQPQQNRYHNPQRDQQGDRRGGGHQQYHRGGQHQGRGGSHQAYQQQQQYQPHYQQQQQNQQQQQQYQGGYNKPYYNKENQEYRGRGSGENQEYRGRGSGERGDRGGDRGGDRSGMGGNRGGYIPRHQQDKPYGGQQWEGGRQRDEQRDSRPPRINKMDTSEINLRPSSNMMLKPQGPRYLPPSAMSTGPSSNTPLGPGMTPLQSLLPQNSAGAMPGQPSPLQTGYPGLPVKQAQGGGGSGGGGGADKKQEKKKQPSKDELLKSMEELLKTYLEPKEEKNEEAFVSGFKDLQAPKRHVPALLSYVMTHCIQLSDAEREAAANLLAALKKEGLITGNQFMDAFSAFLEGSKELETEVPLIKSHTASLAARAVTDKVISLADIAEPLENGAYYPLFLLTLQRVGKVQGKDELVALFTESKVDMLRMLPESDRNKERMMEILEGKSLSFLFPLLRMQTDVTKQLQADSNPSSLYKWIRENVSTTLHKDKGFINALTASVIKFIVVETSLPEGTNPSILPEKPLQEKETALLERFAPVLQKFVHESIDLQLSALYALQTQCYNLTFPKGMLLRFFVNLYNLEVIEEEAFIKWKEDITDEYPGKGQALFQVNQWLTWLATAEEDSDSDEEGED